MSGHWYTFYAGFFVFFSPLTFVFVPEHIFQPAGKEAAADGSEDVKFMVMDRGTCCMWWQRWYTKVRQHRDDSFVFFSVTFLLAVSSQWTIVSYMFALCGELTAWCWAISNMGGDSSSYWDSYSTMNHSSSISSGRRISPQWYIKAG